MRTALNKPERENMPSLKRTQNKHVMSIISLSHIARSQHPSSMSVQVLKGKVALILTLFALALYEK